jgi:hypothetical protein
MVAVAVIVSLARPAPPASLANITWIVHRLVAYADPAAAERIKLKLVASGHRLVPWGLHSSPFLAASLLVCLHEIIGLGSGWVCLTCLVEFWLWLVMEMGACGCVAWKCLARPEADTGRFKFYGGWRLLGDEIPGCSNYNLLGWSRV